MEQKLTGDLAEKYFIKRLNAHYDVNEEYLGIILNKKVSLSFRTSFLYSSNDYEHINITLSTEYVSGQKRKHLYLKNFKITQSNYRDLYKKINQLIKEYDNQIKLDKQLNNKIDEEKNRLKNILKGHNFRPDNFDGNNLRKRFKDLKLNLEIYPNGDGSYCFDVEFDGGEQEFVKLLKRLNNKG